MASLLRALHCITVEFSRLAQIFGEEKLGISPLRREGKAFTRILFSLRTLRLGGEYSSSSSGCGYAALGSWCSLRQNSSLRALRPPRYPFYLFRSTTTRPRIAPCKI